MFCTKCGKELYDGDKFCAHCGAAVREPKLAKYDDVVFNPPFKIEADRRTEEILKTTEATKPVSKEKGTVSFDWNLDGFPAAQPRKTEEVDFNWDSVIEKRNNARGIAVEKVRPEPAFEPEPSSEPEFAFEPEPEVKDTALTEAGPENHEQPISIEELEKELFGSMDGNTADEKDMEPTIIAGLAGTEGRGGEPYISPRTGDERFYTYNQKFDAFQELLDKERERLKKLEDSYNHDKDALDYTWVGEVFPELNKTVTHVRESREPEIAPEIEPEISSEALQESAEHDQPEKHEQPLSKEPDITDTPETEQKPDPPELVSVAAPAATMVIDLSGTGTAREKSDTKADNKAETKSDAEESPSKTKLRYSDIFPRGMVNDDGTGSADSAEAEQKIKTEGNSPESIYDDLDDEGGSDKKHTFAKVIIAILIILIVIEGGILAIKFIAPDSKISLWTNDMMLKVVDIFAGNDGEEPEEAPLPSANGEKEVYMADLVEQASEDVKTIGEVAFSPDLKYSILADYSFEEISRAESFVDADWLEAEDGAPITYGQKLTEALVKHYDSWQEANSDKSLVGINKLEIGEIRTGKEGFYALCRVSYAGEDGKDVIKYQTVYLRISGDTMTINEIKEDKL